MIGVALFAYLDPTQIPSLSNSMKEPKKFFRVFEISLATIAILYMVFPAVA
jgi:amino acid transporter